MAAGAVANVAHFTFCRNTMWQLDDECGYRRPPRHEAELLWQWLNSAMEMALRHYRNVLRDPMFVRSLMQGLAFFAASAIAIFSAVQFATARASNHVSDIFLSNVGPMDVRFLFIYGTFTEFVMLAALLLWRPNRLPFAFKAMALFLLVRAVFISLTHIAPFPIEPRQAAPFLDTIFHGGDLFLSGHTGLPFLAALAFWHVPALRYFYLASTLFFGAIVLLGHYHYSIDVLAALFITYGIYNMARWLFPRDYARSRSSEGQGPATRKSVKGAAAADGYARGPLVTAASRELV